MANTTIMKQKSLCVGDTIRVYQKIIEEGKTRTQPFEGILIAIRGREMGKSVIVRKVASAGVGVERIWPVASPNVTKVIIVKHGNVRRGKLYFLRERTRKEAKKISETKGGSKQGATPTTGETG